MFKFVNKKNRTVAAFLLVCCITVSMLYSTPAYALEVTQTDVKMYTTSGTPVYAAPDLNSTIVVYLERFVNVTVTGITDNGFYRVNLNGDYYIPGPYLISSVQPDKTEKQKSLDNLDKFTKAYQNQLELMKGYSSAFALLDVTGDGIPENKLPLLFKRFYEGDYRKFKTKGTGIGLSLTKDLVELHQGTISVESIPGETTLFTVMIPADRENYADEQIDEEPERPSDEPTGTDDKAETEVVPEEPTHVLVVEDDVDLLTVMTKVLGKHFKVSTATNGLEALAVLKGSDRIEVVVTDYVMPEMNGIELCREIRKDVALSHLPLVMLTAKTQTEYHLEGYDAGADVYLTKPVEMAVLTAQLKALIANRKRLIQKFRQKEDLNVQELGLSELDREFMDKAISTVEQQMEDSEFSNEVFCQMMNMTQSTLYRKLKSLTGMSPNEFIRDVRIKKACMLLQRPDLQVSDVAYMVGFTDPKYFSLIFKKEKGMSPTKYIESLGC